MYFKPNSDVFDAFLATRHGKFMVGAVSFAIGIMFFCIRRMVTSHSGKAWKNQNGVTKYEVYLVCSLFPG